MRRDAAALVIGLVATGFGLLGLRVSLGGSLPVARDLPFAVLLVVAGTVGLLLSLRRRPDRE